MLLAFTYFFLLLCSYYLLRPVRDAMAGTAGLTNLPLLFTATFFVMLAITPLFGALASRIRKRLLLPVVYGFFAANMLLFYVAFTVNPASSYTAAAFFVWLSVFNMFVVSVFWSFMADVFRGEEAMRLFGPITAGGGAGAILGPLLTQSLALSFGTAGLVLLAMVMLVGTIPCIRALGHWSVERHGEPPGTGPESSRPIGGSAWSGLVRVARSPYLLGVVCMIAVGTTVGTFMYAEIQQAAQQNFPDAAERTRFFARLDLAVNVLAFVLQGFVAARLIRWVGLSGALVTLPLVALGSFIWLALAPVLLPLAVTQVLRRAGEFGVAKPAREVLFTVVDPESKYKAKNFIDTVVQRGSDTGAIWLHRSLVEQGMALSGIAIACAAAMPVMVAIGLALGRSFRRRVAETGGATAPATA